MKFNGKITDIEIFSRPMTEKEIKEVCIIEQKPKAKWWDAEKLT